MDSIKGIVSDLHVFIYGGMRTLPITLAGTMAILGLFTANYAMMFLLAGFLIVTPLVAAGLNAIVDLLKWDVFLAKSSDICNVAIPFSTLKSPSKAEDVRIACTTSFAMICFFLGYILTNAISLFNKPSDPSADPAKVSNRKSHAIISILSIVVFAFITIGFRAYTGCEPSIGYPIGILIFGGLGVGWYNMLRGPQDGRLADIFGISNRILPASATKPVACVADLNA